MESKERRIVDPDTGGEKGDKLARFDLIPQRPLWLLAELYGRGAKKYDSRNWEKSYNWSLSYAALQRHLSLWWQGEDCDEETQVPHVINASWHCLALAEFMYTHPEKDDRPCKIGKNSSESPVIMPSGAVTRVRRTVASWLKKMGRSFGKR